MEREWDAEYEKVDSEEIIELESVDHSRSIATGVGGGTNSSSRSCIMSMHL